VPADPTRTSIQGRPHCGHLDSSAGLAVPQYTQRGRWVDVGIDEEDTDGFREAKHFGSILPAYRRGGGRGLSCFGGVAWELAVGGLMGGRARRWQGGAMNDQRSGHADWVVPAVLVAFALALFMTIALAVAVAAEDRAEAPMLIQDLDIYTACLVKNGANVPRIEAEPGGGFTVIVPGSLVDGGIDSAGWQQAADQCAEVAPDLFGALLGEFSGDWFEVAPEEFSEDISLFDSFADTEVFDAATWHRRTRSHSRDRRGLPRVEWMRRCALLENGENEGSGQRIDVLHRQCERLSP